MKKITKRALKVEKALLTLFAACLCVFLIRDGETAKNEVTDSLRLCFSVVIPTLFPFFALTGLLTGLEIAVFPGKRIERAAERVFGISGCSLFAFVSGIVGGAPVGAKTMCDLYKSKRVSKREAEECAALFTLCSPFFLISTSCLLFGTAKVGLIQFVSQIVTVILMLLLTSANRKRRMIKQPEVSKEKTTEEFSFAECLSSAAFGMIPLCGNVVFFSVVNAALTSVLSRFGVSRDLIFVLSGLTEVTKGVFSLGNVSGISARVILFCFFTSFGSISVFFQAASLMKKEGLCAGYFLLIKPVFAFAVSLISYFSAVFFV